MSIAVTGFCCAAAPGTSAIANPSPSPMAEMISRVARYIDTGIIPRLESKNKRATRSPSRYLRHPPRGIKTRAIGIEQQGRHHARIERRLTKPAFVACDDL